MEQWTAAVFQNWEDSGAVKVTVFKPKKLGMSLK